MLKMDKAKLMMEKMGWNSDRGLGKDENGIKKPVRLPYQTTKLGFGYNKKKDELWWEKMFDDAAKNIDISVEKTSAETEKSEEDMSNSLKECNIHGKNKKKCDSSCERSSKTDKKDLRRFLKKDLRRSLKKDHHRKVNH